VPSPTDVKEGFGSTVLKNERIADGVPTIGLEIIFDGLAAGLRVAVEILFPPVSRIKDVLLMDGSASTAPHGIETWSGFITKETRDPGYC